MSVTERAPLMTVAAERDRAANTAMSVAAPKERDRVAKMVEIGEAACEAQARGARPRRI